jgi:hypothetical protein
MPRASARSGLIVEAQTLEELHERVSVGLHLGFLRRRHGFATQYPQQQRLTAMC